MEGRPGRKRPLTVGRLQACSCAGRRVGGAVAPLRPSLTVALGMWPPRREHRPGCGRHVAASVRQPSLGPRSCPARRQGRGRDSQNESSRLLCGHSQSVFSWMLGCPVRTGTCGREPRIFSELMNFPDSGFFTQISGPGPVKELCLG